jgi:DNA-binding NarL/FixJ family response regulator
VSDAREGWNIRRGEFSTMNEAIRVLMVEDNPGDVRLFKEYMRVASALSLEFSVTETLEDTLEYLSEKTPDVILLDLTLPDVSGIKGVRKIVTLVPSIPVVVLTGHGDLGLALEAIDAGAQDCILKGSTDAEALARTILYAIHRKKAQVDL